MSNSEHIDENTQQLLALLYDELDEGEASKVRAKLADDPARAAEFASYQRVREIVGKLPQEEPSNAITAQLLHAASQAKSSASKPGLFVWMADVFRGMAQYPGLAAAASLVLVAGIAGTLYMTSDGPMVSQPMAPTPSTQAAPESVSPKGDPVAAAELQGSDKDNEQAAQEPMESPAPEKIKAPAGRANASGFADGIVTEGDVVRPPAPKKKRERAETKSIVRGKKATRPGPAKRSKIASKADRKERTAKKGISELRKSSPRPDVLRRDRDAAKKPANRKTSDTKGASGQAKAPRSRFASPPPPATKSSPSDVSAGAPAPESSVSADDDAVRAQEKDKAKQQASYERARRLHLRAIALAKKKQCTQALRVAAMVRKQDARYYRRAGVSSDKQLSSCRKAAAARSKKAPTSDTASKSSGKLKSRKKK